MSIEWHGPFTKHLYSVQLFGLGVSLCKTYKEWRLSFGLTLWMVTFIFKREFPHG